jgi:branched-chain amino acid transport system substrate-binding protein
MQNGTVRKREVGLVLVTLVLAGCGGSRAPVPISFGHVAPRSGPARDLGLSAEKGIQLAVEEIKTSEKQLLERPVEVRHPDSEGKAELAQSVAVRLLSFSHVVALIGGSDEESAELLGRVAQQYKVPLLSPTWLPAAGLGPYGFSVGPAPAEQGKGLGWLAAKHLQAGRLAVVTESRSPGAGILSATFLETVGRAAVVLQKESGDAPLPQLARQVVEAKPAAVLIAGTSAFLESIQGELMNAGLPGDVRLLFGGAEDARLVLLADNLSGKYQLYWTTVFVPGQGAERARGFAKRYQERFLQPADAAAALAYDSTRLLASAIGQAETTRGDKVRDELVKVKDFEGVTGMLSLDQSQAAGRPVWVVQRANQQLKVIRAPNGKP